VPQFPLSPPKPERYSVHYIGFTYCFCLGWLTISTSVPPRIRPTARAGGAQPGLQLGQQLLTLPRPPGMEVSCSGDVGLLRDVMMHFITKQSCRNSIPRQDQLRGKPVDGP